MAGAEEGGLPGETICLREKRTLPCTHCGVCERTPHACALAAEDDAEAVLRALEGASLLLVAAPIHFYALPGQLKCLIDRAQSRWARPQDEAARKRLVAAADAVIYCAGFTSKTEGENFDRTFALPEGQAEEIAAAAALNPNLIVVVNSGGGVDFSQFGDRARAILMAWYPGQEGGRAIAEILTGAVSPSGKLPISIERRAEENPTYGSYYENVPRSHRKNATQSRVCYNEGVFVGYRGYDRSEVEPLYPFGFGLSYTTFAYSGLKIARLEDGSYAVSFDVKNTGRRDGAEVAQLYVSDLTCSVPRPVKELKGYEKVFLKRGAAQRVEMRLPREAFAFYDMERHDFVVEPGDFLLQVGASSRDLRLKGTLHVD